MRLVSWVYLCGTLLLLNLLPVGAQDQIPVAQIPLDSTASDSEGDELEDLDDLG